jgi:hypothetical protein
MIGTRRVAIVACVILSSCAPVPQRRQLEAEKRPVCRLKFDSAATVVAVMHRTTGDDVPSLLTGVVELVGPVESMRGDTLIMEPHYIAWSTPSFSGEIRIVRLTSAFVLPDLVFVPIGPGVHVDGSVGAGRSRPSVTSILVLGTLVYFFGFTRW